MKELIKNLLPYGLVCKWQTTHRKISIDKPLFYYPGFGKRLKRIVKFCLPFGLVVAFRERTYRKTLMAVSDLVAGGIDNPEPDFTPDPVVLPPLPTAEELMPNMRTQKIVGQKGLRQPDVTVVTVVFNIVKGGRSKAFRQCLDSVQAQTGVTIEHLIIDGASKDDTLALLDGYDNKRHSMRVFSAPDKGIYDAMNRGLVLANGRYVTFLNSDDFYHDPLGLRDSVARLDETESEFSYAPVVMLDDDGRPLDHPNVHPDVSRLSHVMAFSHQSMVMRTDSFRAIRGFDISYRSAADYDSVLRMVFAGYHAAKVDRSYVTFRGGGYSWENIAESQAECGRMFSNLYGRYLGCQLTPEEGRVMYVSAHMPMRIEDKMIAWIVSAFGLVGERNLPRRRIGVRDCLNVIGLYDEEPWGAWSDLNLRIYATLPKDLRGRDLTLGLHFGAFFDENHPARVTVRCNGCELGVLHVTNILPVRHDMGCPAKLTGDGALVIDLETSYAVRTPGETRTLGISFEQLIISASEPMVRSAL